MYDRCYDGGQVKEIFKLGVELFIDAVKQNHVVRKTGGIRCLCAVCQCRRIRSEDDIKYHLESKGFQPSYLIWTSHGETFFDNQPDQLQRQRQRQLMQQQMHQQRVNPRPPVQQNQAVGRNQQSSFYQPDQFHEDEYRPNMNYTDEHVDQTFFDNLQHDPILQTLIGDEDLEISGFTNATHDGAAFNQGGEIPVSSSGINNIQDVGTAFINQSGGGGITLFNLTSFQGGPNEFNVSGGGRTSAKSASGGRTNSRGASGGASVVEEQEEEVKMHKLMHFILLDLWNYRRLVCNL
ncbi:hypothetical protein TSUD_191030 [Trifolium subterraneum]|uniref:Transposase-associated domain-containing protein n=1 Tax=Trifolium subterraneum TaxID=3900 RepID=A0A2Z6NM56_TRISU|nr:hypothetical protein TSUD_191030 [Trifolium subterraneum]